MERVYKTSTHVGWFYSWGRGSGDGILLACQIIGILFTIGWVGGLMTPFFWILHYFGFLRSDPLEEIVGLDVGYTGNRKHRKSTGVDEGGDEESEDRMKQYLEEFEHRQRERAYFKKMANERRDGIPASSIHQYSLHGSSYHGKKIVTPTSQLIESLDPTGSNAGVQSDSDSNDNPVTHDEERAGPYITAENGVP